MNNTQIPDTPGLAEFQERYPGVVEHGKFYRTVEPYVNKVSNQQPFFRLAFLIENTNEAHIQKTLIIGNRASGCDLLHDLLAVSQHKPIYQSRRTIYAISPPSPPPNTIFKPPISHYIPSTRKLVFEDGTEEEGFDKIVYTTGYRYSYPFLRRYLPNLSTGNHIVGTYEHTWYREDPTLTFVGSVIDAISFRAFEYQAIAVARWYAGRVELPSEVNMKKWEEERLEAYGDSRGFHTIALQGARKYWETLVGIGGQVREGEVGRRFPETDDAFWDEIGSLRKEKVSQWLRDIGGSLGGDVVVAPSETPKDLDG
jgi:hypothetical protein